MPISDRSNSTCYTYDVSSFLGYKTVVTVHYERAERKEREQKGRLLTPYTERGGWMALAPLLMRIYRLKLIV